MPSPLEIILFPCLMDNYGFLVHSPDTGETAAVDTPDAQNIKSECEKRGWNLTHIWNTHHHFDHVGGNNTLANEFDIEVFGSETDKDRIPNITRGLKDGESFNFGGYEVKITETSGHTIGHIVYHIPTMKAAFVGDTLFALGCGRLFEGSPEQMYESLQKIAALPDDTALYCAHEYTLSNGRFAITVEPNNQHLKDYIQDAQAKRDKDAPTVPTTVAAEKRANPFVRAANAKELGRIRAAKDNF